MKVRLILGVLAEKKYWVFSACVESVGEVEIKKISYDCEAVMSIFDKFLRESFVGVWVGNVE